MLNVQLDKQEIAELRTAHRDAKNVREAYRINTVILLGDGWTAEDITRMPAGNSSKNSILMHRSFARC